MTGDRRDGTSTSRAALFEVPREANNLSAPLMEAEARRRIGRDLRLFYGNVFNQPLPERFLRLIDELAANASDKKGS